EPGQELVKSFFTFILVAGVGVGVSQLLITMTDGFSTWILDSSLECDLSFTGDDSTTGCFAGTVMLLLTGSQVANVAALATGQVLLPALGGLVAIIVGIFIIII